MAKAWFKRNVFNLRLKGIIIVSQLRILNAIEFQFQVVAAECPEARDAIDRGRLILQLLLLLSGAVLKEGYGIVPRSVKSLAPLCPELPPPVKLTTQAYC